MNGFISFWRWWVSELHVLFGGGATSKLQRKNATDIIIGKTGYQLGGKDNETLSLEELLIELGEARKKPVRIRMKSETFLTRSLSTKRLPDFHIEQIALTDLSANTPFSPNNSYTLFGKGNGSAHSYFILKKMIIDPLLLTLKNSNRKVSEIYLGDGFVALSAADFTELPVTQKTKLPLGRLALGCAILLSLATGLHFYQRHSVAEQRLDAEIAQYSKQVAEVKVIVQKRKAAQERLATALKLERSNISAYSVWNEFSKIIPDSAWLTTLEIKQGTARITGYAKSSSGLISTIQASKLFETPSFVSPVVAVRGETIERFLISTKLEAPQTTKADEQ